MPFYSYPFIYNPRQVLATPALARKPIPVIGGQASSLRCQARLKTEVTICKLDLRRVRAQVFKPNEFERADMRRREYHGRRASSFKRLLPSSHA
jgi:hypothetical protein